MLSLHTCKTKRHSETRIQMNDEVRELKEMLAHYRNENAYYTLLQGELKLMLEQTQQDFAIELRRNLFGLYLVPVTIAKRQYWFILDTGAQISSIRSHVQKQLQIKKLPGQLRIGSIGGKEKAMEGYLLDTLCLGSLRIHNLPVIALDKQDFSMNIGGFDFFQFDGILGWDILSRLDFEIDDVAKRFKVMKNHYRFEYENMILTMFPVLLVKDAQGNVLKMGLDTGSRMSWMNEDKAKHYGIAMGEQVQAMGFGVHGVEEMKVRMVKEMNLYLFKAHVNIKNMITGRTNIFPNLELDGILGNEIFKNRRIRMINSRSMVLLT